MDFLTSRFENLWIWIGGIVVAQLTYESSNFCFSQIEAKGDYHIDDHHTNEDVGISLGMALAKALGDKKGIRRFGHFVAPLDEALVEVVLDFSGRQHLAYGLDIPTERVGTYDTQLVREFYAAVASNAQMTLHIRQLDGINSHHIIEVRTCTDRIQ